MRYFRYSIQGASFMFIKGDFKADMLYGNMEEITEEQYNICLDVVNSYASGCYQVMPTLIIPATKVINNFNEKDLLGQQIGNSKYLWVWRDPLGNVWAEVTFSTTGAILKKESIN